MKLYCACEIVRTHTHTKYPFKPVNGYACACNETHAIQPAGCMNADSKEPPIIINGLTYDCQRIPWQQDQVSSPSTSYIKNFLSGFVESIFYHHILITLRANMNYIDFQNSTMQIM